MKIAIEYVVVLRLKGRSRGRVIAAFEYLAHAMSFAHTHRNSYRDTYELAVMFIGNIDEINNMTAWLLSGTIPCEGV